MARAPVLNPPIVMNLFAGPGCGKSTHAALLFGLLKLGGVRCELVTEYAKDLVWEGATKKFADKSHITMEQLWRQQRLIGEVDVIITDSPLLLGFVYNSDTSESYDGWLQESFDQFDNLNILLTRDPQLHPYQAYGRQQDEAAAQAVDSRVEALLTNRGYRFQRRKVAGLLLATQLRDEVQLRLTQRGAA